MTTIDFSKALADAKTVSFDALPNGDYDVEVTSAEAVTSGNGKPMIKTKMKVISGPHTNKPVINNFTLSLDNAVAVSIFFRHMKCFGLDDAFFAALGTNGSLEPVASAMTGRRVRLTLGQREWAGEMRNDVKGVKPYTGAPIAAGPAGPGGFTGAPLPGPGTAAPGPIAQIPAQATLPTAVQPVAAPTSAPAPVAPPQPPPVAYAAPPVEYAASPVQDAPVAPQPTSEPMPSSIPAPPALPI